jgi:glycosyltransferase involved in cell wall biosynthesis
VALYTLPPVFDLVGYDHPRLLQHNCRVLLSYISGKLRRHGIRNPLLWVCSPVYAPIVEQMDYRSMVYDCFRYWGQYDIRWESLIANRADLLFAASPGLQEHLLPCNPNIAVIPFGGDMELFRRSEDLTLKIPAKLLRLRRPLLGYLGDVNRHTDLSPVYRAAKAHPRWQFVFAGRLSRANPGADRISDLPNVHFLGRVERRELPRYAAHFDVLFDLLDTDDPDEDVLPSRIYEYLTVGCPIAAMYPLGFASPYSDVIYGAKSPKEFVLACEQAVAEDSGWAVKTRKRYAQQASWEERVSAAVFVLQRNSLL